MFSPTDLNHFLECEHLIQIERSRDRTLRRPPRDAHAELLAAKGAEHEAARLAQFRAEGRAVVIVAEPGAERDWQADAARTVDVMRGGADVIYQGVFANDTWHGISDFLVRVHEPSDLGSWSYEAWDTKLARRTKPYFVLQLCFYTERLATIQGREPEWMVVVLGTGQEDRFRYRDFAAYYRAVRRRFVETAAAGRDAYPYPVFFCMASSTGDDVPRGVDFLFSRNRFNVANSRAKAMAVVVSSPRLMETRCRSVEQMQLVNALCAFVEASTAPECSVS